MEIALNIMGNYTLGKFLQTEIDKRHLSLREFASMVGVTHQTISKFLDYGEKDVGYPSMDFLIKLSKATGVDLATIVGMVEPEATNISTDARLLAERIEKLPEDQRAMIDSFLLGLSFNRTNKKNEGV